MIWKGKLIRLLEKCFKWAFFNLYVLIILKFINKNCIVVLTFLIILFGILAYYANRITGNVTGNSLNFAFNVYMVIL